LNENDRLLCDRLGYSFTDSALLEEALTHPSAGGRSRPGSYERLEFLGDRVLGLAVARLLYESFPDEPEGALAKRFAVLAQRETVGVVARSLELGPHLRMAASEEQTGGRENTTTLGDALEAVMGALYLDGGFAPAEALVRRFWQPLLALAPQPPEDPKTALQEWAQGRGLPLPRYREVGRSGPAHDPRFTMEVEVQGQGAELGEGRSKREAERAAAELLLARLRQPA